MRPRQGREFSNSPNVVQAVARAACAVLLCAGVVRHGARRLDIWSGAGFSSSRCCWSTQHSIGASVHMPPSLSAGRSTCLWKQWAAQPENISRNSNMREPMARGQAAALPPRDSRSDGCLIRTECYLVNTMGAELIETCSQLQPKETKSAGPEHCSESRHAGSASDRHDGVGVQK